MLLDAATKRQIYLLRHFHLQTNNNICSYDAFPKNQKKTTTFLKLKRIKIESA